MDIDGWLRGIGLAQYAEIFRANDIDGELLGRLTNDDLKDIGVASLGHRKKLLEAIAALTAAPEAASSIPVAVTEPKTHDTAERRQVTVMFADLVGSTALSTGMDPEDLREVISAYQKCVDETVRHFGGFVARYVGDGVLVYFGYPWAHEDDAERAVRAGLELIVAVSGLQTTGSYRVSRRSWGWWARRRILRRGCKVLPNRIRSSSPKAREGFSAASSSSMTLG